MLAKTGQICCKPKPARDPDTYVPHASISPRSLHHPPACPFKRPCCHCLVLTANIHSPPPLPTLYTPETLTQLDTLSCVQWSLAYGMQATLPGCTNETMLLKHPQACSCTPQNRWHACQISCATLVHGLDRLGAAPSAWLP